MSRSCTVPFLWDLASFGDGGAIWNNGDLTLQNVYVANSSTGEYRFANSGRGGGIYNESGGSLNLNGTTVAYNTAVNNGGGIYNAGALTLINSTLSTNESYRPAASVNDAHGGGLYNANSATSTISFSTVALNSARVGGGILNRGVVTLGSSIVADNLATHDDSEDGESTGTGVLVDAGQNVIGINPSNNDFDLPQSLVGDPLLTDLIRIEDSVPMHGILPGSIAVDAGDPATAPALDQRGYARPAGAPDAGAHELEAFVWDSQLVVDSFTDVLDADYSAGSLTLREAILWANASDGIADHRRYRRDHFRRHSDWRAC